MRLASTKLRPWVVGAVAIAAIAGGGAAFAIRAPAVGPVPMNHAVHVKAKVDCLQCHVGIMDVSEKRFPDGDVCAGCHKDSPGSNGDKVKLANYLASGKPMRWDPPRNLPSDVFFPHDRHVDVAGFECAKCHPEKVTEVTARASIPQMTMSACVECHKHSKSPAAQRAALDCASCHR